MQNVCTPFYDDGDEITGYVTGAAGVFGKRFVKISGDRTSPAAFTPASVLPDDRGAPHIDYADAGGRIFGVSGYDGAQYKFIEVLRGSKVVLPVVAETALTAFDEVAVGRQGQAALAVGDAAVAATLVTGVVGNKNSILWTAKEAGADGNNITVDVVAATTGHDAGTVATAGRDITVYVVAGFATTTAAQVIAAVNADASASALVTAANNSTSDGTGAVADFARTALSSGSEGGRADQAVGYVIGSCAIGADAQVSLY